MNEDYCVCCGEVIPEGRMVCPICERDVKKGEPYPIPSVHRLEEVSTILKSWSRYFGRSHKNRSYDPAFTKLNKIFPSITGRMADVIDSALRDGEQVSMTDTHIG